MATAASPAPEPNGSLKIRVPLWMQKIAIGALGLTLGWAIRIIQADAVNGMQLQQNTQKIEQFERFHATLRPASELVSKDQFDEHEKAIHGDLLRIEDEIGQLRTELAARQRR